jgi:hypothetical protein
MNFKNCNLTDSQLALQGVSIPAPNVDFSILTVDSSTFKSTNSNLYNSFFFSYTNMTNGARLTVTNSSFQIDNSSFLAFVTFNYVSVSQINTAFKNCTVKYTGSTPLSVKYYDGDTKVSSSAIANVQLSNINLSVTTTGKFINYDPDVENIGEPTSGFFRLGKTIANVNPVSGGYLGWVCITQGYADSSTWSASTVYNVGDRVLSSGHIYEVQSFGTSGKTQPTFPTASGATVNDTVGAATWLASKSYVVGDLVLPSTSNGSYYECTTAGTSGTVQPTWGTTNGATINDNGVIFTTRKIVTWKEVGVKAVFKQYGLIAN